MDQLNKLKFNHWLPVDTNTRWPFTSNKIEYSTPPPPKAVTVDVTVEWVEDKRPHGKQYNKAKKLYYARVWEETEKHIPLLFNSHLRGFKKYHCDHIYPISQGFKESVLPTIIGGADNLRMIPAAENMRKGNKKQ